MLLDGELQKYPAGHGDWLSDPAGQRNPGVQATQEPADIPLHPLKYCPLGQEVVEQATQEPADIPPHPLKYFPLGQEVVEQATQEPADIPPHPLK